MAKETKPAEEKGKPKKRMHLHAIRSVQAHDGTIVHHHEYKHHPEDQGLAAVHENAATSQTPEDAGAHVQDQFSQNGMGGAPGGEEEAAGGAAPEGEEPEAGAQPA